MTRRLVLFHITRFGIASAPPRLCSMNDQMPAPDKRSRNAIPRRASATPAPLSFAQQRLWFLDQLEPGSPLYNVSLPLKLSGPLDAGALQRALSEIIRRHDAFRTRFELIDQTPMQLIDPPAELTLPLVDLSGLPEAAREAEAIRLARIEASLPSGLEAGPLFRAKLLRFADNEHALLLVMHHIVSDGWSLGILRREIAALYAAYLSNRSPLMPELPVQYADYAIWQRTTLRGEILDHQLAYWKKQLEGAPQLLELLGDYPRPAMQSFKGTRRAMTLGRAMTQALRELSLRHNATLFMTLLAAFAALIARYTRCDDIVVGSPIAGRTRVEIENLIGCFVNTLVLRTDCSGNPPFIELLSRVRETALSAYAHQDIPFEKLVEELKPERSLSHSPLFQVMFVLQNAGPAELNLPGLTASELDFERVNAKFDLSLAAIETDAELRLDIEYSTDLFTQASIDRLIEHYETLLRGIIAAPTAKLAQLPLMTEAQRKRVLIAWNDTETGYPKRATIASLFEAQVRRTPAATALIFEDQALSYSQLNAKANRLAHHLHVLGVGPETLVGVCAQRSIEMVAALLAILKAGGAYLPLDPNYPEERLAFMLEDGAVPVLLTQKGVPLPRQRAKLVYVDALERDFDGYPDTDPESRVEANNLAYVIYTSGSTGRPKGVAIEHRSAVALLSWAADIFAPEQWAGTLASTSICFDLSVFELFVPLSVGGAVILVKNALELPNLACADQVTLVNTVPSAAVELLRIDGIPVSVHTVNLAGEPLSTELVRQLYERGIDRVYDLYGPTEDTTYSTFALRSSFGRATIGRPIANTQVYILDPHLNPVPIGVPGELHLGGAGLARGYLNRPELTAEKFIPNPFTDHPQARLYKTGDLARYLPDGNIEFLGRIDHQVKIRGFRIELGEIEAVLAQRPEVKACAVLVREDTPGDQRLIAYVVARGEGPSLTELRGFIQSKLPEYMIPAAFVLLDKMPVTPNGKLDRKALPAPEYRSDKPFVAPRTPAEKKLAAIWAEMLKLQHTGIHDNFFELGGHSLLATQLISRVREELNIDLPLRAIFEAPTVEGLGAQIASAEAASKRAIAHRRKRDSAPVSIAQARLLFLDQLQPHSSVYNVPVGFWIEGALDVGALAAALGEIVRRHETLRTSFANASDGPVQVIQAPRKFELSVIDLMDLAAASRRAEALRLSREDARAPFDLASGPLLRAKLVRLADREYLFILNVHHIVFDGWSCGVLYRELSELYRAYRSSKPSPLPELPIQYADFAVWQRRALEGNTLDEQLAYWKRQLGGALPALELPLDHPRPVVQDHDGAWEIMILPEKLTNTLKSLRSRERVTLFTLLLASFQLLLYRLCGQDDIVLGVPVAGRNRIDTEALIGFFIGTLAIRADLSGNPSFLEFLYRVRKITLDAYDHQDVPFERLVEELRPARSTARNPIFDVLINFISSRYAALPQLDDLLTGSLETHETESKFSMTLYIREEGATLKLALAYQTALFSSERVACMLNQYRYLLERFAQTRRGRCLRIRLWTRHRACCCLIRRCKFMSRSMD